MSYGHANCRDCGRPTNYYPEVGEDESGILCDLCKWRNCDHEWAWEHARMLCRKCGWERPSTETMEYAQERIAALEAEVEELDDKLMEAEGAHDAARRWFEEQKKQFARAEKAEAEVQRLRVAEAEAMNILEGTELKLEQAEAELERLRCCGNCEHSGKHGTYCDFPTVHERTLFGKPAPYNTYNTDATGPCRFTPSRWQRREG